MVHVCIRAFTWRWVVGKINILTCWISSFFSQKTWTNQVYHNNSFHHNTCPWFFKKNVCYVIFYYQTKFYCVIAFTSQDIGLFVFQNWLLTRLWCHKIWNYSYLSSQVVTWPKNQDKTLNILRMKRASEVK